MTQHLVSQDQLEALARLVPAEEPHAASHDGHGSRFDLGRWILESHLEVDDPEPWGHGRRWVFPVCPWNSDHTHRSAYIVQLANGAIEAGCHHNGCHGKGWHDLRDLVQPGWRERRRAHPSG